MRNIISLCAVISALFIVSCNPKEGGSEAVFDLEGYALSFEATGNDPQSVQVTAGNVEWEVKVPSLVSDWLSAIKKDAGTIEISVKDNNSDVERTGRVEVVPSATSMETKIITVVQKANPNPQVYELVLEPQSLSFAGVGAEPQTVTVSCDLEGFTWSAAVEGDPKWVAIESGTDKITVSVTDNDEKKYRSARVVVTPDDPAVAPKAILVNQVPPKELSVPETELFFDATGWEIVKYLQVTAVDLTWTMELVDGNGHMVNWIKTDVYGGMITIKLEPNDSEESRMAYMTLIPDTDEVDKVHITITQYGKGQ